MAAVTELEITKTRQGYRYRIINAAGGAKANVTTYNSQVRAGALADVRDHLSDTAKFARTEDGLRMLAQLMYNLLIHPVPEIERFLREQSGPLFISTDDPEMPLELLHDGDTFLGLRLPLGRGIIWSESPPAPKITRQGPLSILIVADPTGDLPGARAEATALINALPAEVNFKLLQGQEVTLVTLLKELAEGSYDIIHYAGHIGTEEGRREKQAYLELQTRQVLASEITNNLRGHPLVFLNGCRSSARVEGAVGRYAENMARAFIRGGALGLVGTLWDVPDLNAGLVSQRFYEQLLAGKAVGEALRLARCAAQRAQPDDSTWASLIYYGDPTLIIPQRNAVPAMLLDEAAQLVIDVSIHEARKLNHASISSAHLFLGFSKNPDGLLAKALTQLGFSAEGLRLLVRQTLAPMSRARPVSSEADVLFTESVHRTLDVARAMAERERTQVITEQQLLVAFLTSGLGTIFKILKQVGLDPAVILAVLDNRPVDQLVAANQQRALGGSGQLFGADGRLNVECFDSGAQKALLRAAHEAASAHSTLGGPHLLIGLLEHEGGYLPRLVSQQGFDPLALADALRRAQGYTRVAAAPMPVVSAACSARVQRILALADQLARHQATPTIGEWHLVVAFLTEGGGSSVQLLAQLGVNWDRIKAALPLSVSDVPQQQARGMSLLAEYGRDMTEAARQGKINPVIGRKRELEQIVHILTKETRNNPLLIGEAGVGKTAIVEALALHIINDQVPPMLRGKRLYEITLGSLVAGTRYRGDFEERIQRLITEIRDSPDVLIFIDEIHSLVGAGDTGGHLDAANMFKPALARGELRCIGATTPAEYQKTIAQDAALERRFQSVQVDEPSPEETLRILEATRARYEARYGVVVSPGSLAAAIRLSVRYMPERHLPDKAQSLLEEACARVSVGTMSQWGPPAEGADPESTLTPRTVNEATIAEIVAEHKHLPLEQLTSTEQEQLLRLEERLKARVIGQDQAVSALARFVRLARTGLRDPNKPGGVFLFVGPTGVGKTELAKALANALFGADDQLTRFDMSEFMEPHSVAKLIGSPPGYVGYQEEGQLVRVLRRKPYSVVLIDEIEKAAANIFDLFLQLFDEGRLTDEHGQQVDGRHAMYIMTSNVGSELVGRRRMGFGVSAADDDRFQGEVRDRLRQTFRPEFLNRIDEILIFNKLTPENICAIALQQIDTLRARLQEEHGIDLQVEPDAVDLICAEGFVENMGARALQRTIVQRLAAPLSELLLGGTEGVIIARADDQQIIFEMGEPPDSEHTIRGD